MSDVNQVRINELARELEVKAKAIIDLLAGYGVTEKKTHSSSIPADVAEKVRKHLQGVADAEAAAEAKAKADKEARDAAAKAARMRPAAAPVEPVVATPKPVASATSASGTAAPAAPKPAAPAAPPPAAPAVAAPPAGTTTPTAKPAPSVPPATTPIRPAAPTARPAAPAASTHTGVPAQRPAAGTPAPRPGGTGTQPSAVRPAAAAPGRAAAAAVIAPPEPRAPRDVTITEGITIRELAEKLDVRAKELLKTLLDRGVFASINQALDVPTATTLAEAFSGVVNVVSLEEEMVLEVAKEETKESLKPRPPVVTVMGHVDHGKTSLLDAIREADVAAGEAGGITQHIGAYRVMVNNRAVVFIDTPGHEAFTRMRSRGAKVTDIVVLVVAADDGVMPQTKEAIDHAKAANVAIVVAINKIDKPEAQPERVKRQLADNGLLPAEWGGDTEFVEVSAKQKKGIEKLLETILLVADLRELRANPDAPATGTVLESRVDKGRGPVATILVQNGTRS